MRMMLSGLIWACLAPFFYAAMSSSSKLAAAHLNIWQVGLGRFILGLVVLPIVVRILGLNLWGNKRFMLTLRGLCGSVAFLLLVASFQRIPLSLAMVLFYLYPAFTALLSPWVAGEPVTRSAWPFIIGALIGTTIILWPGDSGGSSIGLGHILAVIASVLCALTLLLVRRLGKDNNIYTLFYYLCLTGCLACLGPLLIQKGPNTKGSDFAGSVHCLVGTDGSGGFFHRRPTHHQSSPGTNPGTQGKRDHDRRGAAGRLLWGHFFGGAPGLASAGRRTVHLRLRGRSQSDSGPNRSRQKE
jgi:drug/metabolite transporter (DMT)-like permease